MTQTAFRQAGQLEKDFSLRSNDNMSNSMR